MANGIASFGGIVEGPVVAAVFAWVGWNGVLYLSVAVSLAGAVSVYKADTILKNLDKTASKSAVPA